MPDPSDPNCRADCQDAWLAYVEQEMAWLVNTSRPYVEGDVNRGMKREEKAMYDDLLQKRNDIQIAVSPVDASASPANPLAGTIVDARPGEDPLAGTIFGITGGGGASRSPSPAKDASAAPAPLDDIGNWDLSDPYDPWPEPDLSATGADRGSIDDIGNLDLENPYGLELGEGAAAGGIDPDDWLLKLKEN